MCILYARGTVKGEHGSNRRFSRATGMTLVELMVAAGVGSLVLMVASFTFMTSSRSFFAMGNYVSMDSASRNALGHMTRNIRQAKRLTSFGPIQIAFDYDGA